MEDFIIRNYVYHNLSDMLFKINKLHPQVLDDKMLEFELEYLKEYVRNMKIGSIDEQIENPTVCTGIESPAPSVNSTATGVSGIEDAPVSNTVEPPVQNVAPKAKRAPRKAKAIVKAEPVAVKPVLTFDTVCTGIESSSPNANSIAKGLEFGVSGTAQFQGVLPTTNITQPTVTIETTVPITPKTKKAAASTEITSSQCMARVVSNSSRGKMSYDYMSYPNGSTTPVYGRRCKNVKIENSQFCIVHSKKCEYGIFTEEASDEVKAVCLRKYTRLKEIEDNHQMASS